jgi:hypothetical protein
MRVSDDVQRERAEQRFQEALQRSGGRDPREFYRERMRELRARDEAAFQRARAHYDQRLIPALAREDTDPLAEWLDYGRLLAELTCPGRTVEIDASGRSHPYTPPVPADRLVLHLPTSAREPALLVGLPAQLSPAQRATFDLLVKGERKQS